MKRLLTLCTVALCTVILSAQVNYRDILYLKNGSIIRGIITELIPGQTITIKSNDGNTFTYTYDEIDRLEKEKLNKGLKAGNKSFASLGYHMNSGNYGHNLSFDFVQARQFNPFFSFGLGAGTRYYHDVSKLHVPVYLDFRVNFVNNTFSPYISTGYGYTFDAKNNFSGVGILISPEIGLTIKTSDKSAFHFGIGTEYQSFDDINDDNNISETLKVTLGFSF